MNIEKIKKDYEKSCMNYIKVFEEKHEVCFEFWVADRVGEVASFGDILTFNLSDIKHDIDNYVEKGKIFEWQEHCLEIYESAGRFINYQSYLMGTR